MQRDLDDDDEDQICNMIVGNAVVEFPHMIEVRQVKWLIVSPCSRAYIELRAADDRDLAAMWALHVEEERDDNTLDWRESGCLFGMKVPGKMARFHEVHPDCTTHPNCVREYVVACAVFEGLSYYVRMDCSRTDENFSKFEAFVEYVLAHWTFHKGGVDEDDEDVAPQKEGPVLC